MSDKRIKEGELGKITAIIDRMESDLYGNGKEGIFNSIPRIESKINDLSSSVASHTKVIAQFLEYQATHDGEKRGKKEQEEKEEEIRERERIAKELKASQKRDKAQRLFIYSIIILTAIGLSLTGYNIFKKIDAVETTVKQEIRAQEGISKVTRGGYIKYNDDGLSDSIRIK